MINTTKQIKVTHYAKDSGGNQIANLHNLEDDGEHIIAGSSHPGGGARCIIALTGQWDAAIQAARTRNWPYWIGGCGYSALPIAVSWHK